MSIPTRIDELENKLAEALEEIECNQQTLQEIRDRADREKEFAQATLSLWDFAMSIGTVEECFDRETKRHRSRAAERERLEEQFEKTRKAAGYQ